MNQLTRGKGLFGSVTLKGGATLKGNAYGNIDVTGYSKAAAGANGLYYQVTQDAATALTGTLRGAYIIATNGALAASGAIEGLNVKARAATAANVGNNVALMTGIMVSVDVKNKVVTDLRGMEISLDGGAGGSATTVYGMEISNNTSATFTTTYGLAFNFGSASGRSAFTRDILLQNGETIDNATNGTIQMIAGVLKHAYDAAAYWTVTQADAGGVTFDSVSDGTPAFNFSDAVAITSATAAQLTLKFDAASYMTITVADAGGVTFADTSDGTASFTFSQITSFTAGLNVATTKFAISSSGDLTSINQEADATGTTWNLSKSRAAYAACSDNDVIFELNANAYNDAGTPVVKLVGIMQAIITDVTSGTEDGAFIFSTMVNGAAASEKLRIADNVAVTGVLKIGFDAAAYMTITQNDGAGVTFASVSDGTAGFAFSQAVDINALLAITEATGPQLTIKSDAAAYMTITQSDGAGIAFATTSDGAGHIAFNTNDTGTVKLNSRNFAATSGDIIGFQAKAAGNGDGTATVYGGQISPRFNDGVAGAALVGLQIEPILKGATAKAISGDVRALDVRLSDDGNAGHTVGGDTAGIKFYNLLKSSTFTGGVYPIVVTASGDTQAWSGFMKLPADAGIAAYSVGHYTPGNCDGKITITIDGHTLYIPAYDAIT